MYRVELLLPACKTTDVVTVPALSTVSGIYSLGSILVLLMVEVLVSFVLLLTTSSNVAAVMVAVTFICDQRMVGTD